MWWLAAACQAAALLGLLLQRRAHLPCCLALLLPQCQAQELGLAPLQPAHTLAPPLLPWCAG